MPSSKEFTESMRQRLISDKESIVATLGLALNQAGAYEKGDLLDITAQRMANDMSSTMITRMREEMRQIDAAIARINDGEYGICLTCEEDIGEARLRARPTSVKCVSCKTAFEKATGMHAKAFTNRWATA